MTNFHFRGTQKSCACQTPHAPHVVTQYPTVRNGNLSYFCLGKAGDGITIDVTKYVPGGPADPDVAVGTFSEAERVREAEVLVRELAEALEKAIEEVKHPICGPGSVVEDLEATLAKAKEVLGDE